MPRSNNISIQNNFTKGLITEATGLSFPENACTDTNNCVFNTKGSVSRRYGIDFEDGYTTATGSLAGSVVVSYLWKNAAGQGDVSFTVVQIGNTLHFYSLSSSEAMSAGKHATTIDLSTYMPSGITSVATMECQFSSGNGLLFVTNPNLDSFYVTYDPSADTLTGTEITIQIRDFEGDAADALAIDGRPTSNVAGLSAAHRYNLENQGWTAANLAAWDTARTDMPSNSDVPWYFKSSTDAFDFSTVGDRFVGNSPAPKGHFVYNVYDTDRATHVSGASESEIATDRVSTCAFFAGRGFYSGLNSQLHGSRIFFTQIVERPAQYGYCYQINDPASEKLFDLLPSDGGTIDIHEAGIILKMIPFRNSLLIFASNGVWAISGSQGTGFTATDYSIDRISAVQNASHTSFVDVEGIPYWWNLDGIWRVTLDPQTHALNVESITYGTIRGFFDDILLESKLYARGVYDPEEKKIQWVYRSTRSEDFEDKYVFDRILNFNVITSAFYPWTVSDAVVKIHSLVDIIGAGGAFELNSVVNSADTVIDGSDNVITFLASTSGISSTIKYFASYVDGANTKSTFAEARKDVSNWTDWLSVSGGDEDFDSYFVAGYMVRGNAILRFQDNYVNIFSDNTEDTSFLIRGQWNYSTAGNSGKWSTAQIFSLTADDFSYKPKRIKIRGSGVAAQIRIENYGNNQFHVIGWAIAESGNKWV